MSILFNNKNNIYIDHCKNISNIYQNISFGGVTEPYEFNKKLFYICRDTKVSSRKRKFANDELQKECSEVKAMYEQFLAEIPITLKTKCKMQTQSPCNTSDVRNLAQNLFESTVFDHKGISGGNNSDTALKSTIKNETFLIPPNSRFYCGCVSEQCKKLAGEKFELIVADPPWWNKYIRRLKNANDKLRSSVTISESTQSSNIGAVC
ncbi:uncharacterized protein isoform X4 [Choristoneura fumiferana]|uniref:uncharacterized protein isoform X5 n=1 Tax=Choristoneura fumiferana TaxID=7141 RepID=UPI003D157EC3